MTHEHEEAVSSDDYESENESSIRAFHQDLIDDVDRDEYLLDEGREGSDAQDTSRERAVSIHSITSSLTNLSCLSCVSPF